MIKNIFVINLEKRIDRLANITKEYDKVGLKFKTWKAIDGSTLEVPKDSCKKDQYNAKGILGCMLSHYTLIQHAKKENLEYIFVTEDDIIFCDNFIERLKILDGLDFDLFYLGGNYNNCEDVVPVSKYLYKAKQISGTYGYIMRNTVFKFVLDNMNYQYGSDEFFVEKIQKKFKCYASIPFMINHVDSYSDIALCRTRYKTKKNFNKKKVKCFTFNSLESYGRLANQLFEIAGTLGIADKYNAKACFPEKWKYKNDFNIPLEYFLDVKHEERVIEQEFNYVHNLVEGVEKEIIDIQGTLQSEKYFIDIKKDIINWLKPKITKDLGKWAVGIHVRRGDYVDNPAYVNYPPEYYLSAILKYFNDKRYVFYICSDDIEYCKLHFIGDQFIIEKRSEVEDLAILCGCRSHIICNSSFSWMGAYLSESKKVIRPPKIFKGKYSETRNEKDFWQKEWILHEDYKIDLKDVTFIIPVSYDHPDRIINLKIITDFLNKFDTNIIVGEQGGKYFKEGNYKYINFPYKDFHRTKMLNRMTMLSGTPIVINWDADVLVSVFQIYKMAEELRNDSDFIYPYDGRFIRVGEGIYKRDFDLIKTIRDGDIGRMAGKDFVGMNEYNSVGGAIGYKKKSFIEAGMENENFIAYTPEDVERYYRFNKLEYKVSRIKGGLYHLNHYCGSQSNTSNPFFKKGVEELNKIKNMTKKQLKDYSKQDLRKVILVCYADEIYSEYQKRLISIAEQSGMFDLIFSYNRKYLVTTDFYKDNKNILDENQGGGYCLWKPYIILETMKNLSEGDIILYMDAMDMFDGDIRAFLLSVKEDILLTNGAYKNKDWTKRDCFIKMGCDENKYHDAIQLEAGVIVCKNTLKAKNFITKWLSYCTDKSILSFDKSIFGKDFDTFKEHRYDQSILTNLKVKYNIPSSSAIRDFVVCNVPIEIKPVISIKEGENQYDAMDITFIIPVSYDTQDRKNNLETIIFYLKRFFKTNIIIGEQGGNFFEGYGTGYIQCKYHLFYRTKIINDLIKESQTEFIFNWDADVLIEPKYVIEAINKLRSGDSFVFPYNGTFKRLKKDTYVINEFIKTTFDFSTLYESEIQSVGGVIGFRKSDYIKCGLENENIIGWGYEDVERVERIKKLGYNIVNCKGALYHIEHDSPNKIHPYVNSNRNEYKKVSAMEVSKLIAYIASWKWIKNVFK